MKRRTQNVRNSLTHKHIGSKTQRLMLLLLCCIVFNIQQALACYYPPTSIGYLCDGCLVGEQIVFSGDLSHGNGDLPYLQDPQWIWDFGDGSSGSGPYPEHTYTQAGTYTVSLVYYDCKGWAGNLCTFQITIDSPPSCTVSPTSVSFGSSGGTQSISVTLTNITGWGVGANQSWTVVSPTGGYNSGSFTITCSANTSTSTRSGSVTVYSAGGPRTISVTQAGIPQYTLTYSTVSQGRLQGASPQTVTYGSSGTAVMVVSSGGPYHFVNWSDGSTSNPRTDQNVTANITVTANLAIDAFTLTYTAGANGSISGASPQTVNYGANGTPVTAVPNTGYYFVNWSDGSTSNPRTAQNVTDNKAVTANFAINTFTLTYSTVSQGRLQGASPQTVTYGSSGTAVMVVSSGGPYHFVNWSDGSTSNPRTDQNVTANITVTANLAIDAFTLTYTAGANGTISGTSPQTVTYGANGTAVMAVPNTGYHFVNWGDGSTSNPRTDQHVSDNKSVTANFASTTQYTLTVTVTNGTVVKNPDQTSYNNGTTVQLTATPATGYTFTSWSGDASGSANPLTVTMNGNKNIAANFAPIQYTLTLVPFSGGNNGRGSVTGAGTVTSGVAQAITASPGTGSQFSFWWVLSGTASIANQFSSNTTVTLTSGDATVGAYFYVPEYNLTTSSNPTNAGTISGGGTFVNGQTATVTATPGSGGYYSFTNWSGDASGTTNPLTITMDGNKNIIANFSRSTPPYTLTINATNGTVTKNPDQTNYADATSVQLTATPQTNYVFTGWSGDASGTTNPLTVTMDGNKNITANFIATYTLTISATCGTVSKNLEQTNYTDGTSVQLTATPQTNYVFTGWSGDATGTTNPLTVTMDGNKNITANFALAYQIATNIASKSFTANWEAKSGATGYILDVSTDWYFTSTSDKVVGYDNKDVGNTTSYSVTGLSPNTRYYFRVRSYNGTQMSGAYSFAIDVITAPDVPQPPNPYTSVSTQSLSFSSSGESKTVTVSSNTGWGVSSNFNLIKTIVGGSGNGSIKITLPERQWYPGVQQENFYRVSVGTAGLITVSQEAPTGPYTNISPTSVSFGPSGGQAYVDMISSNTIFGTEVFSTSKNWISAGWDWLASPHAKISITCAKNMIMTPRSGTVTISYYGITTATITVSQAAGDPYVNTDPARLLFFASGGSTNVTVSSNTSWSASTSDSWLSASGAGTGNGSITIACTKNTGTSARIGTVSVSGGGNITVYQGRQMYAKINGNLYPFDDLITDSLQSIYNANSDAIKNLLKAKIDAECNNKMGFPPDNYRYQVPWPTELQPITFSQEGTDLYASLKINNLRIHWDQSYHGLYTTICKLESTQKDIPGWITIKARIQLLRDGTKYSLNLDNPSIDVSNFVFRSDDDAVKLFASGTVNDVNHMISASTDEMIQGITNNFHFPIELSNLKEFGGYPLTPDQAQEVLNAVPIIISLGTPINGNLVINLDIMPGGSDPALPTNPHYSYAGFASPYYAFQQSLLLPGVSTKTEQQQILIDKMADYGANAIRCSIPWGEIFPSLTPGNLINGNPDDLVAGTTLDGAISAIPTTVWANTDMIFERASARGLQVIPQIPQQEQDLPKINGHIIAPDPVKQGDGYSDSCYYVAPNTYLYYLKIFVNAAVKKYGNRVSIWTIESEFNAARIGTFIQWRHGDSWQKTASGEFQDRYWRILVNAVRNNDPTAKVASNLHILNLMDGINRLGPDLDIIGLDVYPNMYTAYPVIGDIVGEFVRATRRVLNNRGWANKEVQVMEASYPGIDPSMDPSDGVSIDECMYKFSYYRQKKFVEDAVNSALKFGAKGFFYWGFLDDENNKSAPDGKFINFGSLVDIHTNRSSYSFKPAASAFLTTGITGGLAKRSHGNEEETIATVPTEYGLSQNYPNPFNPTTVVSYQLPAAGHMTLKIYDMLGREVVTLVDGIKNAGYYNATFDASRLASGVYFTRFTAQPQDGSKSFVQVRKMLMMK